MGNVECCGGRNDDGVDYADDADPSISMSEINDFKQTLKDETMNMDEVESSSEDEENDEGFTVKHAILLRKDGNAGAKLDMELLYGRTNSMDDDDSGQNFLSKSPTNRRHAKLYRRASLLGKALNIQTLGEENPQDSTENDGTPKSPTNKLTPIKSVNLKSSPSATTVKKKKNNDEKVSKKQKNITKKTKKGKRKSIIKNQLVVL